MSRKILLCYYRDWAKELSDDLIENLSDEYEFYTARHNSELEALHSAIRFDLIFFIGWSSIVKKEIVRSNCIYACTLHLYLNIEGAVLSKIKL